MTTSQESTDEDMDQFKPLLEAVDLDRFPPFALFIRYNQGGATKSKGCNLLPTYFYGSFHILFQLQFTDGIRWVLKVPATGYKGRFDDISARALLCEAQTMRLLRSKTTIPVPEVYAFNTSVDHPLGCAFILMEYIDAIPAQEIWFDASLTQAALEQVRGRILRDLASAMSQLSIFEYEQRGSPTLNERGDIVGIRAAKTIDLQAELDRQHEGQGDDSTNFCEVGPFSDPKAYFLHMYNRRRTPGHSSGKGLHKLLRLLIDWMDFGDSKFTLRHPDFNLQNILVSKDGELSGVIDWDGIAAVPRAVGYECYPSWLTRDWDPIKYGYPDSHLPENSPEELHRYRELYASYMEERSKSITRRSLLCECLEIAANDPRCTNDIVRKLLEEIGKIQHPQKAAEPLYLYDTLCAIGTDQLGEDELKALKEGFRRLCTSIECNRAQ